LLRPDTTPEAVTKEAAERFGHLSASLQARGVDPHQAAHCLVQRLFCLFAEDVGLLPKGLFKDLLARSVRQPERFASRIEDLLTGMRDGSDFGAVALDRIDGAVLHVRQDVRVRVECDARLCVPEALADHLDRCPT
jgi:hypothetical protein